HHRADPARLHHARGRVPALRGRPVLPDPQRRDARALQALRGARGRASGRDVRRPPGPLPVPEHGPGGGAGAVRGREAPHAVRGGLTVRVAGGHRPQAPAARTARWTLTREAALVAVALGVLYLITMTSSHHEAEDSLGYAA